MVSDNEVLDEVRAALHAEVADVTASPALLASVRRRHARRRATRRWAWLIATPLVAAAAAAVVVLPATRPREVEPVNVALVLKRTTTALDGVGGNVVYERAESTGRDKYFAPGDHGLSERWHAADGSRFRYRASVDGSPLVDLSRDTTADVFVDYRARTYRERPGEAPESADQDDVWTPEEVQEAIKQGRITDVGPGEPIDGTSTLRLTVAAHKGGVPIEMWVNATTYLPVRWRWAEEGATAFDVTWLPPTPENLDQLTAPIPPGFSEVR